ncbi:MAG: 4-hydroxy-tetrahydrodipicolinate synthase [Alphaproteobacteria bacterium ADurb.Bin438]|nr:MAG: 4-hydroxy-tetrahydrodipicolinate synthase [Alphaproteobacteria bacterium ADurb.Bin438]
MKLRGTYTALVTPFKNGKVDEEAYAKFIEWQIKEGVSGVVPCGTTGESATLSFEEHEKVIKLCIEVVNKRVPVIAGTGANSTEEAIKLSLDAKKAGADYLLLVAPYYNKPSQEGIFQHYKAIASAVDVPQILYNVPGRTAVDMSIETIGRLSKIDNIVGIKDAHGDLTRAIKIRRVVPDTFSVMSGEDGTIAAFLAHGGDACISVTSNIAPSLCAQLHKAWWARDLDTFAKIRDTLAPVHEAMFCETNPCPVKYAASLICGFESSVRLPLWEITDASKEKVKEAMKQAGLI